MILQETFCHGSSEVEKPTATVNRFHQYVLMERDKDSHDYDGAAIEVDAPAIAFTVRWRRDAKDKWRTFEVPALERDGHAAALVGETRCGSATIPLGLLEHGIELELGAKLPDGKTIAVTGLPSPFVVPKRQPPT